MIAVFIVPYGPEAKSASLPETLEMAISDATSLLFRCGMTAFDKFTVAIRSTLKDRYQFSSVSGIASALTLLTTMSIPPSSSAVAATQSLRDALSLTSKAVPMTLPWATSSSSVSATA